MFSFQRSSQIKLLFRLESVLPDVFIDSESICKLLLATIVFLYFLWVTMTLPEWGRSVTPNFNSGIHSSPT